MADQQSLAGLWAHLLGEQGEIENQIEIVRPGPTGRWIVQFYSFLNGDATNMGVVTEERLCDAGKCVLYADSEAMNFAYEHGPLGAHSRRVADRKAPA